MIDVMIIEDDTAVREQLKSIISWDSLSIRLVCEAEDSESAKELYEIYNPKIVITDINLPIVSGLDLAHEFQKNDPDLRFIIITGYSDFDLVRQSVGLRAVNLLSKPIQPTEINASLSKAIAEIQESQKIKATNQIMEEIIQNNILGLQKVFMSNLLWKEPPVHAAVQEKMNKLKITLDGNNYVVAVLSIYSAGDDANAMALLFQEKLSQWLAVTPNSFFNFLDDHSRLVCVVASDDENLDYSLEKALLKIRNELDNIQDMNVFVGIGDIVHSVYELYLSYTGARAALDYRSILGNETISYYKDIEKLDVMVSMPETVWGTIRKNFRSGDAEALKDTIKQHISFLSSQPTADNLMLNFYLEYVAVMSHEAVQMGLQKKQLECCVYMMNRLFQTEAMETCAEDAMELADKLIFQAQSRKNENFNYLISKAKDYIRQNISDKMLNLDQISEYVGLSKNYFCMLFHQVEGINFSNYLKRERFDLAKKLLVNSHMKVFEISEACGFSNAKYFSYVFKRTFGYTPLEYQREVKR